MEITGQAEETGNCIVSITSVAESCTQDWRKKKEFMLQSNVSQRNFHGQKAKYPEIEEMLYKYVCDKREFYIMWYKAVAQISEGCWSLHSSEIWFCVTDWLPIASRQHSGLVTLHTSHPAMWHHIPKVRRPQLHHCKSLKSHKDTASKFEATIYYVY